MTDDAGAARAPVTPASALIVALERYDNLPGAGVGLPGSVRSGARFASWLLKAKLCDPARITLMTSSDDDDYLDGKNPGLAPDEALAEMRKLAKHAGGKVNEVAYTDTFHSLKDWISGGHGPAPGQEFFYLFWIGHGVSFPEPDDHRICLLGADADRGALLHVELTQLFRAVGDAAPGVHEIGFVSACREPVWEGWRARLDYGSRLVPAPDWVEYDDSGHPLGLPPTRAYMCAASQGESTKIAGFGYQTFADYVLQRLDVLGTERDPALLFDGFLDDLATRTKDRGQFPELVTFGYARAGDSIPSRVVVPQDGQLTPEEISDLVGIARRIDEWASRSVPRRKELAWLCREAY